VAVSDDHQPANSFHFVDFVVLVIHFQFNKISIDEVIHQLQHLDVRKATGPNCISAFFLKAVASEIAEPLTVPFNQSLATGLVPSAWKFSNVSPVHMGGVKDDPGNFCPISIVPIVTKSLEKLIANQLSSYLESHGLLYDHQGAYRNCRSSEQILLFAVDTIVHARDQGLAVCAAFLDLRKAFNSLDHVILLERLQKLRVCDVELKCFQNYLCGCFQQVKCGITFSDWGPARGYSPRQHTWSTFILDLCQ